MHRLCTRAEVRKTRMNPREVIRTILGHLRMHPKYSHLPTYQLDPLAPSRDRMLPFLAWLITSKVVKFKRPLAPSWHPVGCRTAPSSQHVLLSNFSFHDRKYKDFVEYPNMDASLHSSGSESRCSPSPLRSAEFKVAQLEYFIYRLEIKWQCNVPSHSYCVCTTDGGHYAVSTDQLWLWASDMVWLCFLSLSL